MQRIEGEELGRVSTYNSINRLWMVAKASTFKRANSDFGENVLNHTLSVSGSSGIIIHY